MAARARKNPATFTLQRLLGPGAERKGSLEEREVDALAIFGVDDDAAVGPLNAELRGVAQQRVGLGGQTVLDHVVGVLPREDRLLPHVVEQLVVAPVDAADVDAVIRRRQEEHQGYEAAERAGTPAGRA